MYQKDYQELAEIIRNVRSPEGTRKIQLVLLINSVCDRITHKLADYLEKKSNEKEHLWVNETQAREHRFNRKKFYKNSGLK